MTIDIEEETAAPTVPPGYCHQFHADVSALHGEFRAPIRQRIESHIPITLNDRRGGHLTRYVEDINIEGLIFVKRAFTRVSGSISEKYGAWVTLAATVLEGVNFLEVLTADRVVAQVSTEHAFRDGHVPRVSFLGTKFENLKINGIPVGIEYDFDVCGPRPARDQPYNTNEAFTAQARERINEIANSEFLCDAHLTPAQREELYQEVRTGVNLMTDLIDSLLEFARTRESLTLSYGNVSETIQLRDQIRAYATANGSGQ